MERLSVVAAYDRSPLASYPSLTEEAAFAALQRAHSAFADRSAWLTPADRKRVLERLRSLVAERAEALAIQAAREGGKPLVDSRVELQRATNGIECAAAAIARLTGTEVPMGLDAASMGRWAMTYREPRGVVLAISAFNHPFNLLIHQVVTAIAAGCPVLVKPASSTPMSCMSLIELLREAGLPDAWCQPLLVSADLAGKLVADPRVAFLSFVGSARVGWALRSRLAPGSACSLEHGGVAPVIVDETADLRDAVPRLLKGGFYHAGQVCVSVQRIYVHASVRGAFVEDFVAGARKLRVGDPTDSATEVGPLIHPREVERVHEWVGAAKRGGAQVLCGGEPLGETTYAPTVLLNPPDDAMVSTEEVFGPVVCVYDYEDLEVAIGRANAPSSYFQAAVFTQRLDRALDLGRRLHGTTVMINDHTAFRVDWMPFGGHQSSGLGVGGIEHSMRDMTIERMVVFRM